MSSRPATHQRAGHPRARRAVILVLVLWVVAVMIVIASSLALEVQVSARLAQADRAGFQAYELARAGVVAGMTHLQNDLLMDNQDDASKMFDSYADVWAEPDTRKRRGYKGDSETEMGRGTFEFEVTDEEGKIPLNSCQFLVYKALVMYYGDLEGEEADNLAQCMLDWRDPDDVAGQTGEKENEHYSLLAGHDARMASPDELPVQMPNENYLVPDQLVDVFNVMGVGPELYWGDNPDDEEEQAIKARNDAAVGRASKAGPVVKRRSQGGKRRHGGRNTDDRPLNMYEILTCNSVSGRINVNTASLEALTVLLFAANQCQDLAAAEGAAEAIVRERGDRATKGGHGGKDDDDAFKSDADLAKVSGIDPAMAASLRGTQQVGVSFGFRSDTFKVKGIGKVGNATRTIETVVRRTLDAYNPDDARLADIRRANGRGSSRPRPRARTNQGRNSGGQDDNMIRVPGIRVLSWEE